jgi:uncharacterized membrane protein YfcA
MDITSLLPFVGFVTGFIDSIAGGGGLISLPVLTELLGAGAKAIGTNKIVGASGALVSFLVYFYGRRQLRWRTSVVFLGAVIIGAVFGAQVTPYLPKEFFKWAIIGSCPFLLWIILKRDILLHITLENRVINPYGLALTGLVVGFYDGFFGPGGGTFMLLALIWQMKLPLIDALILSKLANTLTASSSLISYSFQGFVDWKLGSLMAMGMVIGSFVGAKLNSKHSAKILRPVMVTVILGLVLRLLFAH